MLTQTAAFNAAFATTPRSLVGRVVIGDQTFTGDNLTRVSYVSDAIAGDSLEIGSANIQTLTVEIPSVVDGLADGMQVTASVGVLLPDGTYEYAPLGVFFIDELKRDLNARTTTVTALDYMAVMNGVYNSALTYPATIKAIAAEIASLSGATADASLASLSTTKIAEFPADYTYRQAISSIAALIGGFATFTRDGKLAVRKIGTTPAITLTPDNFAYSGFDRTEKLYTPAGMQVDVDVTSTDDDGNTSVDTTTLQAGSSTGLQVVITAPNATQTLLNSAWNVVKTASFYPYSLNWFGNPALEAGDLIAITDVAGTTFKVPNLSMSLEFDGGLSMTSAAEMSTDTDGSDGFSGSLADQIRKFMALSKQSSDAIKALAEKQAKDYGYITASMGTYLVQIYSTGSNYFKNGTGSETLYAYVWHNGEDITDTINASQINWSRVSDDKSEDVSWGAANAGKKSITVAAAEFEGTAQFTATVKGVVSNDIFGALSMANIVDGANGVGVKSSSLSYAASASGTTQPTSWASTIPSVSASQYLWTRTTYTYTDGSTTYSYSVGMMGATGPQGATGSKGDTGAKGDPGATGAAGPKGADGLTSYTHLAYATSADGKTGFSVSDSTNKTYIGMYVDQTAADSTDSTKYKWTLVKGADGSKGVAGPAGADGKTPYFHTAYATSADGSAGFSTTVSAGKTYIGTYTDYTSADSTSASSYTWVLIKGDTGATGSTGAKGDTGNGVKTSVVTYGVSSSGTASPTTWQSTVPSVSASQYLWTKTLITYTDATTSTSYSVGMMGATGPQGATGSKGLDAPKQINQLVNPEFTQNFSGWTNVSPTIISVSMNSSKYNSSNVIDLTHSSTTGWAQCRQSVSNFVAGGTVSYSIWAYATQTNSSVTIDSYNASNTRTIVATKTLSSTGQLVKFENVTIPSDATSVYVSVWSQTSGTTSVSQPMLVFDDHIDGYTLGNPFVNDISSTTTLYASSTSATTIPTFSSSQTTPPTVAAGSYLWTQVVTTYSDGTSNTAYTVALQGKTGATGATGSTGVSGANGADGVGVSSSTITYQSSTSGTAIPTGTWATSIPTVAAGSYLWTRTVITYSDSSTSTIYSPALQGKTGATGSTGSTGPAGNDGNGISSTAITYQASSSGTTVPTGTWATTIPSVSASQYLWTRTIITYTNGTTSTVYTVGMMGATGPTGATGAAGSAGTSPTVSSTAIVYQQSTSGTSVPTGTWVASPPTAVAGQFMWSRTTATYSDGKTAVTYAVAKSGTDGATGATGATGSAGADAPTQINSLTNTEFDNNMAGWLPTYTGGGTSATMPTTVASGYNGSKGVRVDGTNGGTNAASFGGYANLYQYDIQIPAGAKTISLHAMIMLNAALASGITNTYYNAGIIVSTGPKGTGTTATLKTGTNFMSKAYSAMTPGTWYESSTVFQNLAIPTDAAYQYVYINMYLRGSADTTTSQPMLVFDAPSIDGYTLGKPFVKQISSTAVSYSAGSSGTTPPTSGWVATPPTVVAGSYLWTRTTTTYSDGTTDNTHIPVYQAKDGATGSAGSTGAAGVVAQSTAPSNPVSNSLWLDTSQTPPRWKRWTGSAWTISQFTADDISAGTMSSGSIALGGGKAVIDNNGKATFTDVEVSGGKVVLADPGQDVGIDMKNGVSAKSVQAPMAVFYDAKDAWGLYAVQYILGNTSNKFGSAPYQQIVAGASALAKAEVSDLWVTNSFNGVSQKDWTNLTLTADFKQYGSGNPLQYKVSADRVSLHGVLAPNTTLTGSATAVTIAQLPDGFRPSQPEYFLQQGTGTAVWLLTIATDGKLGFSRYRQTNDSSYRDVATSVWLPISASFDL